MSNSNNNIEEASTSSAPLPLLNDLASILECPVCFEIIVPPILQCEFGHLVCANCRPKLLCCPTCRAALANIRNLAMEQVAYKISFVCKYHRHGCRLLLSGIDQKTEHEENCPFRPYLCPCPQKHCNWEGKANSVTLHLLRYHSHISNLQGSDIIFLATDTTLHGTVDWMMIQSCFDHDFFLLLEKVDKDDGHSQYFCVVHILGSSEQADKFTYRLVLNGARKRLTFESVPYSGRSGPLEAISNSDCLVFDDRMAHHFMIDDTLRINVVISLAP